MREPTAKAIELITAASMIGSALSGCATTAQAEQSSQYPKNTEPRVTESSLYDPESTETPFPTQEAKIDISTSETNPFSLPVNGDPIKDFEQSSNIPSVYQEEKPFNYEILNISNWNEYEIDSVERKEAGYGVTITNDTSMYMIPLRKDNFVDERKEVKEIIVPFGSDLEIAEVREIVGPNNEKIRIGLVANTYGGNVAVAILLGAVDENGVGMEFSKEREEKMRTVSYVVTEDFIYPNKVVNTLVALRNISEYQEANGQFKQGQEYSYLDMIGLKDPVKNKEYENGLTSAKSVVRGGGVCAMATGVSSLVHLQDYKIVEQWAHPSRYAQGPFSPSEYEVDATVDYNDQSVYDFRWSQEEDKYLKVNLFMTPSDIPFEDTQRDGVGGPSDVFMVVSLSFTDTPVENQSDAIEKKLNEYQQYRESLHQSRLNFNQMDLNVLRHPFTPTMWDAVDLIYNIEDISGFDEIIEKSWEFQDVLELQEAVNSYPLDSEVFLSTYLKDSEWYKNHVNEENKEKVDRIIGLSTIARIEGQPLQCVGFVMLASWLYPELNIPYVGSAAVFSARELIPPELTAYKHEEVSGWHTNYGAYALGGPISLEEYMPGDLFVRTDGAIIASTGKPSGHIGLILGKITKDDGSTVLLVADSNRHNDGRIKIFSVDEYNMEEVFGANQRYIIRSRGK